ELRVELRLGFFALLVAHSSHTILPLCGRLRQPVRCAPPRAHPGLRAGRPPLLGGHGLRPATPTAGSHKPRSAVSPRPPASVRVARPSETAAACRLAGEPCAGGSATRGG